MNVLRRYSARKLLCSVIILLLVSNTFFLFTNIAPVLASPGLTLKWTRYLGQYAKTYIGPVASDLNGDGKLEIVLTGGSVDGGSDGTVTVLDGTTGATIWQASPGGIGMHSPCEIADINNDEVKEIIVSGNYPVVLFGNNGSVYWKNTAVSSYNLYSPVADIDGNGYYEIFLSSGLAPWNGDDYFYILSYNGKVLRQTNSSWHPCWGGLTIGDANFDGIFELYQGDRRYGYSTTDPYIYGEWGVRCLDAQTLTPRWNDSSILCSSHTPMLADVDKNGILDVIVANQGTTNGGLAVLNAADGSVVTTGGKYRKGLSLGLPSHSQPTIADIDGDGNLEIITCRATNPKIWDLYDWKLDATLPVICSEPPKVGDVTGDGKIDIIAVTQSQIVIYSYDEFSKTYVEVERATVSGGILNAFTLLQDIDGDGYNELTVTSQDGTMRCFDTSAPAPTPRVRSECQFYSERHLGAAEYVPAPGPLAPQISGPSPSDGAANVPVSLSQLTFKLTDYQHDPINYTVTTNPNIGLGSGVNVPNGQYAVSISDLAYSTTYTWTVTATDGIYTTIKTYTFLTGDLPPWYSTDWQYRRQITIDHTKVSADQTDFPVLIDFTDAGVKTKAQTDGDDFVFTDFNNVKLDHQIELYDYTTGHLIAWVRIPTLSSTTNTILYLYYGNPTCENQQNTTAVWDTSHKLVLHLNENSSPHQCRLWGMIANTLPEATVLDHLINLNYSLKNLGGGVQNNNDGWGLAYYATATPTVLRGEPPAYTDPNFNTAAQQLASSGATIAVGHVRKAASGATDIPNPHPFIRYKNGKYWALGHNGVLSKTILKNLIGPEYLAQNQPTVGTNWDDPDVVDTDLYMLYVLECIEQNSWNLEKGIADAVTDISKLDSGAMNFFLTDGTTLWGFRKGNTLYYYYASGYSAIASQPPTSTQGSWVSLNDFNLVTLTVNNPPSIIDDIRTYDPSTQCYDSTINANNGELYNGVIQGIEGKIDGGYRFDGVNDYIEIPHSSSLAGYTQAFTVSFWIKLEDTSRRQTILGKYNTGTNQRAWFVDYNPVDRPTRPFGFYASQNGNTYSEWWANFVPAANTWYYVTVVWEANAVPKFYVNGAQVSTAGTATISSIYNNAGVPLHIARCTYNTARYFKGSLDEIRISNPARSASYILTSYNNQLNPATFYALSPEEGLSGKPIIVDPYPANDAKSVPIAISELSFNITDYQHDLMNVTVTTAPNIGSQSLINVPSGRYTVPVSGLTYATIYNWTVTATDGTYTTTKTYGFTTELAPAADDIIFNSNFDMGNLVNVTYQNSAPGYRNYTAATNYTTVSFADKHWWFYFSMENVAGKTVTISIVNGTAADYSTSPTSGNRWPEIEPVYSYDNINWQRVPLSGVTFNRDARTFTINVTVPIGYNKIWLAPVPPYNIAKRDALFAEFASNPYLTVTSLGTTPGGQELKVATITDPAYPNAGKFKSYVIAQQHAGEVGSWNAEGLIRFLLSDDPTAATIRRSYIFRIVPIVNVDGVYQGVCRYTPLRSGVQYDLNRWWNTNPITNAPFEVRAIYQDIQAFQPNSFDDFHSTINTEQVSPKEALTYTWSTTNTEFTNFMNKIKEGGWPETVRAISSLAGGAFQNVHSRLGVTFAESWENPHDELSTKPGVKLTVNDWMTWGSAWAKGNYLYFGDAKAVLNVSTVGSGSVAKNPDNTTYAYGTSVQLTATADVGYTFSHWTGDLTGDLNPATIVMTGNKSVTAVFVKSEYSLAINVEGSGSVSRNDTGPYYYGSVVKLTAIADPNWAFSEWSGDLTGTENPATITITKNMTITAHFTGQKYNITASVAGIGGSIDPSGLIIVTHGQNQTFIMNPDVGYHVSDVLVDGLSVGPLQLYTFYAVDRNHTITAVFAQNEYILTINIVGSGSVIKNPEKATYTYGETVELTATANTGWTFSGWSGDLSGLVNPVTITMTGDKTITATFTENQWWSRDWQYRKQIKIDHTKVSADQTSFPVLIEITDSNLIGKAQTDGDDFVFTDSSNVKLDHQIELYNSSIGRLVVWVKVPSLSSTTDTMLYMYYGNPSCGNQQNSVAVWDASCKLVLHLNENAGAQYDSTINGNNGTPFNGVLQGVAGKINGADTFDGVNDYIEIPHSSTLAGYTQAFTVSFWIKLEDTSRRQTILGKYNTGTNQRAWFVDYNPVNRPTRPFGFYASQDGTSYSEWWANFVPAANTWYYVTIVWEANTIPKFYINGAQVSTAGTATIASIYNNIGVSLHIARCPYDNTRYFKGSLDEIRISNPARSATYILTSYNNQQNPTTFYTVGAEESFAESYVLTVVVDGSGSVTIDPVKTYYTSGETVILTAIPNAGYEFQGWSGDLTGTENPATINMTSNKLITAHFVVKQYTITSSVSGTGGTINPAGAVIVSHGEDKAFTITANVGYHILDVIVDGESQGSVSTYTFHAVDVNHTITATFAQDEYTLTVAVSPESSGAVSRNNTGPYHYGDVVELTANPSIGWSFSEWAGHLSGSQNPATITMDGDKAITAVFTQNQYTLTITRVGNGSVVKAPDKGTYVYGETVTLTATAETGWAFTGWSGDITSNDNPIIITMDGNKSVTATFTQNHYTLTVMVDGGGTVSKVPDQATYTYGSSVELTANANLGWTFSHWSGALTGSDNPATLNVTANATVTAHFTQNQYTLSVTVDGNGSVTKNPNQPTYTYGTVVELNATADLGWTFSHWSGDLSGSTNSTTIVIDGNKSVTAVFTQNQYTLTITKIGSGSVTKTPDYAVYAHGETVTLTATSDAGWTFAGWSGDISSTQNPIDIIMDSSKSIIATFTQDQYTLTISVEGDGTVAKSPEQTTYTYGTTIHLTASANLGWSFSHWSGDLSSSDNPVDLVITGDMTVTANFTQDQYTLTIVTVGSGSWAKNPDKATYTYGETVTLTASASIGWTFGGWSGDLSSGENPVDIVMDNNKTVTVTFTQDQYTLTIDTEGSGSVSKNPDQTTYTYGSTVELTAVPVAGWVFSGWSGDFSSSVNPVTVIINGTTSVTATFTAEAYTLTVSYAGSGSGSVSKSPNKATYGYGDVVQLTATPDAGSSFAGWSGDFVSLDNPVTVIINGTTSVTATFTQNQYTLTIITVGDGVVSKLPDQGTYTYGASVQLTATGNPGWTFSVWSGDLTGSVNPATIVMDGDKNVTATFTQNEYALTINIVGSGSVSKNPDQSTYHLGEVVQLTATAVSGWTFSGWSGDLTGTTNPGSVTIDADPSVTATFTQDLKIHLPFSDSSVPIPDASGNGNVGTPYNGVAWQSTYGGVYSFDGTNDYITVADSPSLDGRGTWTQLTIEFWVRPDSSAPSAQRIIRKGPSSGTGVNSYQVGFQTTGSYLYFDVWAPGSAAGAYYEVQYNTLLGAGTWYHVVCVYEAGVGSKIYVNGVDVNATRVGTTGDPTKNVGGSVDQPLYIGARYHTTNGVEKFFDGNIDDVQIYSVALSSSVVQQHYDATKAEHADYALTVNTVGSGTVTKNPSQATYAYGTSVELTAVPDSGWSFSGWSGDASGSVSPTTVTMTGDKTVTATFAQIEYTLTVNVVGSGSVARSILGPYHYNDVVELTANADSGWEFSAWSGDLTGTDNPASIIINADKTITATFTEIAVNTPPTASDLSISPSAPKTAEDLVASYVYYDAEGNPEVGSEIRWYKNDVLQPELNDLKNVPASSTTKGDVWYFTVRPSDGMDFGELQTSQTVTILNSPPLISSAAITPKPAYNDNTLTATPSGWYDPDADPEGYVYQWQKWNGADWQDIAGATESTLAPSNFVNGDQIRVACTPYDGEDYGETKYDTVTIENRAPTITGYAPTVGYPCINTGGNQLFTVTATDPDGDPLSYEWYMDSILQSSTTESYTFTAATGDSGVHNVTVAIKDDHGAQNRLFWYLTVDATFVMPFDTASTPVSDYAGVPNTGTVNGATYITNGKIGGAYAFAGSTSNPQYISVADSPELGGDGTWTAITIEFWMYPTELQNGRRIIAKRASAAAGSSYQIGFQTSGAANRLYFDVWNTAASPYYLEGWYDTSLPANQWYHVVCTYSSGAGPNRADVLKIYINGEAKTLSFNTGVVTGAIMQSNTKPLEIGRGISGSNYYYFQGYIDEVRIYPKALTADQVSQSYHQTMNSLVGYPLSAAQLASASLTYFLTTLTLPLIFAVILLSKTKQKSKLNRFSPKFLLQRSKPNTCRVSRQNYSATKKPTQKTINLTI